MSFYSKYIKYKTKYLRLKNNFKYSQIQQGSGTLTISININTFWNNETSSVDDNFLTIIDTIKKDKHSLFIYLICDKPTEENIKDIFKKKAIHDKIPESNWIFQNNIEELLKKCTENHINIIVDNVKENCIYFKKNNIEYVFFKSEEFTSEDIINISSWEQFYGNIQKIEFNIDKDKTEDIKDESISMTDNTYIKFEKIDDPDLKKSLKKQQQF
jgi:hypothetical protein